MGGGRRQGSKLTLCSIRIAILTNNQSALVGHPLKKVSLAYLMRMWFVKCVFSGMGVNIGKDRVAILFQCKEHTFMYFWVPKLLGIFFLFDLFSSKGVYRVTCFPDWWSSADWSMFSPTRLIIAIILVHWDCFCENFTFYNIGNFHVNSWKFYPITINRSPIPNQSYTIAICDKFYVWTAVTDCQIQLLWTWIFICKCTNLKTQVGNLVEQRARINAKKKYVNLLNLLFNNIIGPEHCLP